MPLEHTPPGESKNQCKRQWDRLQNIGNASDEERVQGRCQVEDLGHAGHSIARHTQAGQLHPVQQGQCRERIENKLPVPPLRRANLVPYGATPLRTLSCRCESTSALHSWLFTPPSDVEGLVGGPHLKVARFQIMIHLNHVMAPHPRHIMGPHLRHIMGPHPRHIMSLRPTSPRHIMTLHPHCTRTLHPHCTGTIHRCLPLHQVQLVHRHHTHCVRTQKIPP
mmetsp:Transcript_48809/g.121924  ORF Transcript_48809/g.121924 Transcript_48809/m.121924 type:complete len:222 (-) Transcript_48809:2701-3366(-)